MIKNCPLCYPDRHYYEQPTYEDWCIAHLINQWMTLKELCSDQAEVEAVLDGRKVEIDIRRRNLMSIAQELFIREIPCNGNNWISMSTREVVLESRNV
jgi:hypothetical protein